MALPAMAAVLPFSFSCLHLEIVLNFTMFVSGEDILI